MLKTKMNKKYTNHIFSVFSGHVSMLFGKRFNFIDAVTLGVALLSSSASFNCNTAHCCSSVNSNTSFIYDPCQLLCEMWSVFKSNATGFSFISRRNDASGPTISILLASCDSVIIKFRFHCIKVIMGTCVRIVFLKYGNASTIRSLKFYPKINLYIYLL